MLEECWGGNRWNVCAGYGRWWIGYRRWWEMVDGVWEMVAESVSLIWRRVSHWCQEGARVGLAGANTRRGRRAITRLHPHVIHANINA